MCILQVSAVCVLRSTLTMCVLSVEKDAKRHAVGRVLFPLEGELGQAGRVLWRDLDPEEETQCSELGDVQISLSYSSSLQRLSVVVLRARGLQLVTEADSPALLGVLVLGPFMYARGLQLQHWMDMINKAQEPVKLWHRLGTAI
ncbi:hypothetical protein GOODEAATRI_016567 [Goodea atripinnis]|uniref:Uncharacterized protein n=1 Tax=Goodea atripinnis TaxID=208336 RepID=A0ABV0PP59_9TELE